MSSVAKKVVAYSMIGILQVGLFSSVASAAPGWQQGRDSQQMERFHSRHDDKHDRDEEKRRQHEERQREEDERHEREMKRKPHESRKEWRERQEREKERHDQRKREIAALLIGVVIGVVASND